ncbi:TIR domain-containing protein [Aquamicrobium sp.]|uniref:TIR domain-containing protein n=1 Tax=Aquamicrobium sp. TaxID=1872579 RepID=UPI00349EAEFA
MAMHHRIFIAFAIEDKWARDYLVGQARNERSSFEFTDMSVKEPWDTEWKTRCRSRIRGCDGTIALVSANTERASGQRWEIKTSREEGIPLLGIYTTRENRPWTIPSELQGVFVHDWNWSTISGFLSRL